MKECTIILPMLHAGLELIEVHTSMIEEVVKAVGNCRASPTSQFYRGSDGKFIDVDAFEYKFAIPDDFSRDASQWVSVLAEKYGKLCHTKHVYIVSALGVAQFIDTD